MQSFLELYTTLNADNLHRLREVYSADVRFVDPAHEIRGIDNLVHYFESMYRNVRSITFDFEEPEITSGGGYVRWTMIFSHKRLAGGRPIQVDGLTYIEQDDEGKVCYHRDYFDLGAMVYEHITVLGRVIQFIKKGLGQ